MSGICFNRFQEKNVEEEWVGIGHALIIAEAGWWVYILESKQCCAPLQARKCHQARVTGNGKLWSPGQSDSIRHYSSSGWDRPEKVLQDLLRNLDFILCSAGQSLFPVCTWHLGRVSGPPWRVYQSELFQLWVPDIQLKLIGLCGNRNLMPCEAERLRASGTAWSRYSNDVKNMPVFISCLCSPLYWLILAVFSYMVTGGHC